MKQLVLQLLLAKRNEDVGIDAIATLQRAAGPSTSESTPKEVRPLPQLWQNLVCVTKKLDRTAILFEAEPDLLRLTAPRAGASNSAGLASTVIRVFSRGVSSVGVSIAVLLYLGSIGLVSSVTTGIFFGSGFLLLGHPSEQIRAGSRVYDRNTEVSPLRPGGSSADGENGTPFGGDFPVPRSTANGAALIAPAQTAGPDEAGPSWKATSTPPPLGGGSDQFRKLSRASNSRSDRMLGKARTTAGRAQSTKADGKQDPEESAADRANEREYNRLALDELIRTLEEKQ